MKLLKFLTRQREVRPSTILTIGLLAVLVAAFLWMAGIDGSGIVLSALLFFLTAYTAHLSDPRGGALSARRGAIVGGLTMLGWTPWVVCRSSYERSGVPYPNSIGEALMLGLALVLLFIPFGAAVGMTAGVIGGRAMRTVGSFARRVVSSGKTKCKRSGADGFSEDDFVE